jgi:hypothetical protein
MGFPGTNVPSGRAGRRDRPAMPFIQIQNLIVFAEAIAIELAIGIPKEVIRKQEE